MTEPSEAIAYDHNIDPLNPDSFEPNMPDVFRALPLINRFNGQTNRPYSVAAHSLMCEQVAHDVYNVTKSHLRLAILLHDASEAYLGDIVRPIKHRFEGFGQLEDRVMYKLYCNLGFTSKQRIRIFHDKDFNAILHEIDTRMAVTEADMLTECVILPHIERYDYRYVLRDRNYFAVRTMFVDKYIELHNAMKAAQCDEKGAK